MLTLEQDNIRKKQVVKKNAMKLDAKNNKSKK